MSAQDMEALPNMYTRNRVRRKPIIDLNAAFPDSNLGQEGTSTDQGIHVGQTINQIGGVPVPPIAIDLEAVDNDVIISSPRSFAEAKYNSRTNRGRPILVDVESGDWVASKRRRTGPSQTFINYDQFINLEGSSSSKSIVTPPPPPKEPSFSCPVCMGPLVEETSTKCGHIFCKGCIKASIAAQNKCPTCRRKVLTKDLIRIYLPATS